MYTLFLVGNALAWIEIRVRSLGVNLGSLVGEVVKSFDWFVDVTADGIQIGVEVGKEGVEVRVMDGFVKCIRDVTMNGTTSGNDNGAFEGSIDGIVDRLVDGVNDGVSLVFCN